MTVTFFGHRNAPSEVVPRLETLLEQLVERGASDFLVGHQGAFDAYVKKALEKLKRRYPHIRYAVVLAYLPQKGTMAAEEGEETVFPEGLERTPPRFAVSKRNRWMLSQADTVVVYVTTSVGGAAGWKEQAEKQGKTVINVALEDERI